MSFVSVYWSWLRARLDGRAEGEMGAANVEYALLVAFIAVFCIAGMSYFGLMMKDFLMDAGNKL